MDALSRAATPNGRKISIMLEELGLAYEVKRLRLDKKEQKQDWYLRINPNGRIPAIVDRDEGDFAVFESGAILLYLAEKTGQLLPGDRRGRSTVIQWLMFQMGGVGPMQRQAGVFYRYAPERIDYAISRYQRETRRLYEVLDKRLQVYEYLAGDYSIADIATHGYLDMPGPVSASMARQALARATGGPASGSARDGGAEVAQASRPRTHRARTENTGLEISLNRRGKR